MVQVDLPAAFALGQIFGFLSKDYLKKEKDLFKSKLLGPFNFFLTCGFVPGGLFLLVGWPAWEVMYVTSWVENTYDSPIKAAFYVLFVILMVILGNFGYILAHHWYQKGKDKWVIIGSAIGLFLTVLPFMLKWGVWMNIGTYAEIQSGAGYSFWDPPFFHGWLGIMSYLGLVIFLSGLWFRTKSKQL